MVEQLQAAKQTGEAVYLAVSDAIGAEQRQLRTILCVVREPDGTSGCLRLGKPNPNYPQLDSILGETTMDGILRVLEIPRELYPAVSA